MSGKSQSQVISYEEVVDRTSGHDRHLLLGNGFSIACDPKFDYGNLYKFAKAHKLGPRIRRVFDHLGTNDFERVMRLLEDADWIAKHYGFYEKQPQKTNLFRDDLASVKNALIEAITQTHLDHPNQIPEVKKKACATFFQPYKNIFTTNYDALLYWIEMYDHSLMSKDGFDSDEDDLHAPYVVFSEQHVGGSKGIFFIHGAVHLYAKDGQVRKHCWNRTNVRIIDFVRESLAKGEYPMFVAEGEADKKLEQIRRNGYLSYCYEKLGRIQNSLVVFGLAFGDSDKHIGDMIARTPKLTHLYVGLYGDPKSAANKKTQRHVKSLQDRRNMLIDHKQVKGQLEVVYYDAATARAWG